MPWFEWLAAQVDWPSGGTVVEVGGGAGALWAEGRRHWPAARYVLTDQSAGMVATARERGGAWVVTAYPVVADAQCLPFADSLADVVVANHMLYHVPDIPRAVSELARVLRPDGVAVVSTNGRRHMVELAALLSAVFPDMEATSLEVSRFGRESGGALLSASFADVEWRDFADDLVSDDPADVIGYMTSFPPGEQASPAERAQLADAVEEAFVAGGGRLRITKDTGVFLARQPR